MRNYILDGARMITRDAAHDELRHVLELPEYYGRNLDALWDCVSTMRGNVILINAGMMEDALGTYAEHIEKVFKDAETDEFTFTIE